MSVCDDLKLVLEINSGNLNVRIGWMSITITDPLYSILEFEANNKCLVSGPISSCWSEAGVKIRNHCGSPSYILPAYIRQWNTLHLVTFICIRPPLLSFANFVNVFPLFLSLFLSLILFHRLWCGHLKKKTQKEREWERKTLEERVEYNVLGEWKQTNSRVFLIFLGCQRDQAGSQDGTEEDTDHTDHGWEEPAG